MGSGWHDSLHAMGGWTPDLMTYVGFLNIFAVSMEEQLSTDVRSIREASLPLSISPVLHLPPLLSNEACLPSCLRECQGKQNYANSKHVNIQQSGMMVSEMSLCHPIMLVLFGEIRGTEPVSQKLL